MKPSLLACSAALAAATVAISVPAAQAAPVPASSHLVSGVATAPASPALSGLVVALDPGHQLGNSNPKFSGYLAKTHFNGYMTKSCNTTGTATNSGYPEATFTWKVAKLVKARLEALGASVPMTRHSNSWNKWGPCVDVRGRFGASVGADLTVSIHGDGADSGGYGFFVMEPTLIKGYTDDILPKSVYMARHFIRGMVAAGATTSTYISGGMMITPEISTLNLSDVPVILVECGNMRNASDAHRMSTASGQAQYADWLVAGIRAALKR